MERLSAHTGPLVLRAIGRGPWKCRSGHCSLHLGSALLPGDSGPDAAKPGRDRSEHTRTRLNGCSLKPVSGGGSRAAEQPASVSGRKVNRSEHDGIYRNWFDTNFQESIWAP